MILWTLRHTKPSNPQNVCYGRSDFDVASTFESEYPPAVQVLKENCKATALYASPLKRCYKLAEKASAVLGLPIQKHEALYEINFGSWEQVRLSDVPKAKMDAWKKELRNFRFPTGESFHDVDHRVGKFITDLLLQEKANGQETETLFVTHAGVIASIEHSICGVPEDDFVEGAFPYAMVTRFELHLDESGKPRGTFQTLYGGIQQASLAEYIKTL